ncbi:hypothetical protein MLD38_027606 [Melastoma candidum]|uniref:Uncharacterized protein n=1 Tax=Melastoma candidum TaxID=119954 RepID=A0ACB9P2A4_9MYRT|nr:hypothetical protein MLD38_027606 [Melastoma candidum]
MSGGGGYCCGIGSEAPSALWREKHLEFARVRFHEETGDREGEVIGRCINTQGVTQGRGGLPASTLRVRIRDEGSSPSFHGKIDQSPLKSYFDHLERKLNDSVLRPINNDVTARVQCLKDKQEMVSDKCCLILGSFFKESIVENPKVAVKDWQEVAAINLLAGRFMSESREEFGRDDKRHRRETPLHIRRSCNDGIQAFPSSSSQRTRRFHPRTR